MNRVRATLVRSFAGAPNQIEAAHPSTAARCNLNKCSFKMKAKNAFPPQSVHFEEMKRSTFCLVPAGDSPPSSRLYLAVAAGCIPVFISDHFEGAFASSVPWPTFSLRVAEADALPQPLAAAAAASGSRRRRHQLAPPALNLTAHLLGVSADAPRLRALQAALQAHAVDVLWEAPGSRCGHHALELATHALRNVCVEASAAVPAPTASAGSVAAPVPDRPQVWFGGMLGAGAAA